MLNHYSGAVDPSFYESAASERHGVTAFSLPSSPKESRMMRQARVWVGICLWYLSCQAIFKHAGVLLPRRQLHTCLLVGSGKWILLTLLVHTAFTFCTTLWLYWFMSPSAFILICFVGFVLSISWERGVNKITGGLWPWSTYYNSLWLALLYCWLELYIKL